MAESAQSTQSFGTDGSGGRRSGVSTPLRTSPLPQERLGERVEMRKGEGVSVADTRLVCPICNEEMVSQYCPEGRGKGKGMENRADVNR